MSTLKEKAIAVNKAAAELLTHVATDAAKSAEDVVRRHAPPALHCQYKIGLETLGRVDSPEFVRHVIKRAGIELGVAIGEKLRHTYKGLAHETHLPSYMRDTAVYEAKVYVFTPEELRRYTEAAFRAGQCS